MEPKINHNQLHFMKMHGLGNDFVVFDARNQVIEINEKMAMAIADRHCGVGFDQIAILTNKEKSAHLKFLNSDGSSSSTCGNATRCIARFLMDESNSNAVNFSTDFGNIEAIDAGGGLTSVNMGHPQISWDQIPLADEIDTLTLPIEGSPCATGMGNPHCTFFVDDIEKIDLETLGAKFEHHPLFPQRTNVQFAQLVGENHLRMRVWERGVGVTLASGSSSCATAVAAHRRGLTGKKVTIDLDGGKIEINWTDIGIWMTGPTEHVFSGTFTPEFLARL